MRIHTNATYADVTEAANTAGAYLVTFSTHGSRTHNHGYEVKLEGNSRRRPNGGSSGVGTGYAATWDQWGVFLGALYAKDPDARCGSGKHPVYADAEDFDRQTDGRFADGWPEDAHGDHTFRFQGVPYSQRCTKCSAVRRWDVLASV